MEIKTVQIPYPEELPEQLGETPEEFEQRLWFLVATKLYELGHVSSGRAAGLAGMERVDFLNELGRHRISAFNYSVDELEREIREARARGEKLSKCPSSLPS